MSLYSTLNPACLGVIDCNNFFVSCERIFRPDIWHKPVIVLSNNDGCVVARSNEAKVLGIKMGQPAFQIESLIKLHQVKVFSGNFELYHSISSRIMQLIKTTCPKVEVYSVDEAFIDLSSLKLAERHSIMLSLRQAIWQEIGLPVSIGLAKTKTLAKLANELVKSLDRGEIALNPNWPIKPAGGVLDLSTTPNLASFRKAVKVEDIWGIGRKTAPKLKLRGIHTAEDLATASAQLIKNLLTLPGQQTKLELQGQCCWPLHLKSNQNQSLMVSRSFGRPVAEFSSLASAISQFSEKIALKLRRQGSLAQNITVFVIWKNNHFSTSHTLALSQPTQLVTQLVKAAILALRQCLKPANSAIKVGVFTTNPKPKIEVQSDLFENPENLKILQAHQKTQLAMDVINQKYGFQTIQVGRSIRPSKTTSWLSRQTAKSPGYTTSWNDLVKVF